MRIHNLSKSMFVRVSDIIKKKVPLQKDNETKVEEGSALLLVGNFGERLFD